MKQFSSSLCKETKSRKSIVLKTFKNGMKIIKVLSILAFI